MKPSLKSNHIIIYKDQYKDDRGQVYPQIGIALNIFLSEEIEHLLVDQLLICAGEDEKEREETGDELFEKCRKAFNCKDEGYSFFITGPIKEDNFFNKLLTLMSKIKERDFQLLLKLLSNRNHLKYLAVN
jgi:hypothetical protein